MNGPAGTAEQLRLTLKTDFGVDEQTPNLLGGELFLSRLADDMGDEPRTPAEFAAAAKRLIILSTAALLETLPVGSKNINALFASLDRNDASLAILARAIGGPAFGKGFGIELEQIWEPLGVTVKSH